MELKQMKKVLLAIGDQSLSLILRKSLEEHRQSFEVLENEVLHSQYLEEVVETEQPDILILHDTYLVSHHETQPQREDEWFNFVQKMKIEYDDSLRIVFVCERDRRDPFLANLVLRGVYDIFNDGTFSREDMIEQLKDKPRFSKIKHLVQSVDTPLGVEEDTGEEETSEQEQISSEDRTEAKRTKEKQTKIVNKQVVQKVVNKNVIKRDYNIQVTSQVEKIVGVPVERKLILIGSPFARTGSTFVSHLLARELTKMGVSVSYVESPYTYAYSYDRFIGHEKAPDLRSKFYQFTKEIDPKLPSVFEWELDGINMVCKHPANEPIYSPDEIPFDVYVKILLSQQSTITIVDVGDDWNKEIHRDIYDIASNAYFVIEPDISAMQYVEESENEPIPFFREVLKDDKAELIGNRFEPSLLKNEVVQQVYKDKLKAVIPSFSVTDVFDAQYQGAFFNDTPNQEEKINEALKPIIEELLPKEFLKMKKKKTGLFKSILNKKVRINKKEMEV
jgi:hypothetical protein